MRKFLMSFVIGGLALLTSAVASAAPTTDINTTLGDWKTAGFIEIGDKVYEFVDSDLADTIAVDLTVFSNIYTLQLSGFDSGALSAFLEYTVTVTDGSKHISTVALDTTHAGSGVEVVKEIDGDAVDTLTSTDGVPDSTVGDIGASFLDIYETFSSGAGGSLINATNAITQVPEPSTLVLAGLAAIGGLVYSRRRKS